MVARRSEGLGKDESGQSVDDAARVPAVFIRSGDESQAMSWQRRLKVRTKTLFRKLMWYKSPHGADESSMDEENCRGHRQYRLEGTRKSGVLKVTMSYLCGSGSTTGGSGIGITPNQNLASYLHWMFRVNFIFLFAAMCAIFFLLVMIFATFIISAGLLDNECVRVGGAPFGNATSDFADAFALSWTTFSTVGYGSTYTALSNENSSPTNCLYVTFICSLESFLGVFYSGFCGAILFGKVLRIQNHAQVIFSDPIVIRYGSGIQYWHHRTDDGDNQGIPCPVLEFRLVNRLFGDVGGEIMDATLHVVTNVNVNDADSEMLNAVGSENPKGRSTKFRSIYSHDSADNMSERSGRLSKASRHSIFSSVRTLSMANLLHRKSHILDGNPSARLVNKPIFSNMTIEASEHPFFKRVWIGRHVLDETSPILKPKVRRAIHKNNGYWPQELNSHTEVRKSLQFNQILVSLNGVSNVSAANVYAQKIYDFVDVSVGYQFVNILYKDTDGTLKVDPELINDVREQHGGGGEPLVVNETGCAMIAVYARPQFVDLFLKDLRFTTQVETMMLKSLYPEPFAVNYNP